MDIVSFQMDLLRLAAAVGQEEQFQAPIVPVVADSLAQLGRLETTELSAVESGIGL